MSDPEACWDCEGKGDGYAVTDAAFFPAIEQKGQRWTCPCGEEYRVTEAISNVDRTTVLEWEGET